MSDITRPQIRFQMKLNPCGLTKLQKKYSEFLQHGTVSGFWFIYDIISVPKTFTDTLNNFSMPNYTKPTYTLSFT